MKRSLAFILAACFALMASTAFALDDLPNNKGLGFTTGGEYLGFKVRPEGADFTTDIGAAGGYAGVKYDSKFYALELDLGGAILKAKEVFLDNSDFSNGAFYARTTVKGAYPVTDALKVGATASYTYIAKTSDKISGELDGVSGTEKIKIGPTSIITVNAPMVQVAVPGVKGLDVFGGYSIQLVDIAKAELELSAAGYGSMKDKLKLNAIDTSGGILGATYAFGKYEVGIQGALRANNASSVNGSVSYRF